MIDLMMFIPLLMKVINNNQKGRGMGNTPEQQIGYPIDYNIIALLLTGQTDRVIEKVEKDETGTFLKDSVNFRNDNLLHYACAKNNPKLALYLVKKNPRLATLRNNQNELPAELATDQQVKEMCMPR